MTFSKAEIKYYLTSFRTRKSYLIFQILQLLLAIVIIVAALMSPTHFRSSIVLYLQLLLLFVMSFDLFIVKWISEGSLWKANKIDLIVLIIFMVTFAFLCLTEKQIQNNGNQGNQIEVILQTDDIIIIAIVMIRYAVQIYRIIVTIIDTRKNISLQRKIKQIDLNVTPPTVIEDHNQFHQDAIVREKIASKLNSQRDKIEQNMEGELE